MSFRNGLNSFKKVCAIATLLMGSGLLIACQQKCDTSFPYYQGYLSNVDQSLITGDPCSPPCWHQLVPGESTEEEALEILQDLPFVDENSIELQSWYGHPGQKLIYWAGSTGDEGGRTGVVTIDAHGKISDIFYGLRYPLTLEVLVEQFGIPDKVLVLYEGYYCYGVSVIWFDIGLRAGFPANENQKVTPETLVHGVSLFPPVSDIEGYFNVTGLSRDYLEYFQDWESFEAIKVPW